MKYREMNGFPDQETLIHFPPDVDVDKPDEKSIMTYVSQFFKAFPETGSKVYPRCPLFWYFQRCYSCVREIVINFRFCPAWRILQTLNAQCVHPMLVKKNASCYSGGTRTHDLLLSSADVLTTRPPHLAVATGWFEYIEQWVLRTIFPKMLFLHQGNGCLF